eukprot:PhF_6_TR18648/c0_g1_i1/m.27261
MFKQWRARGDKIASTYHHSLIHTRRKYSTSRTPIALNANVEAIPSSLSNRLSFWSQQLTQQNSTFQNAKHEYLMQRYSGVVTPPAEIFLVGTVEGPIVLTSNTAARFTIYTLMESFPSPPNSTRAEVYEDRHSIYLIGERITNYITQNIKVGDLVYVKGAWRGDGVIARSGESCQSG